MLAMKRHSFRTVPFCPSLHSGGTRLGREQVRQTISFSTKILPPSLKDNRCIRDGGPRGGPGRRPPPPGCLDTVDVAIRATFDWLTRRNRVPLGRMNFTPVQTKFCWVNLDSTREAK